MNEPLKMEALQKQHFDALAERYAAHYGDTWSLAYRDKFINTPLFKGIDLNNAAIVDALCGSGEMTGYLLARNGKVTGVDISEQEMAEFSHRFPQCEAWCRSILNTGLDDSSYDCVVIVGGLHHLHPHVEEAIAEVHRILKKGGYFVFIEPHKGSLPDIARSIWYKRDKLFTDSEAAIDLVALKQAFTEEFEYVKEEYKGNIAYLFVLNSMIFRIPLALKRIYSPLLFKLESLIEKIQGRRLSCFVVGQWIKR